MQVNNIKDLGAVIDLCRKKGVARIVISGIEIELNEHVPTKKGKEPDVEPKVEGQFSDEELLLWSSQGA